MFQKLMNTSDDFVVTLLRLALGVVFFAHGAQKVLGWFGGFGFRATLGFFTTSPQCWPFWLLLPNSLAASAC